MLALHILLIQFSTKLINVTSTNEEFVIEKPTFNH